MAWPEDISTVYTNLSDHELKELMECLDDRYEGEFVTRSTDMFASAGSWVFEWRGNQYQLDESFETVWQVQKLTDNPMLPRGSHLRTMKPHWPTNKRKKPSEKIHEVVSKHQAKQVNSEDKSELERLIDELYGSNIV